MAHVHFLFKNTMKKSMHFEHPTASSSSHEMLLVTIQDVLLLL
jgi:hypothetical protein